MTTRPALEIQAADEYAHLGQLPDPPRPYTDMQQLPNVYASNYVLDYYFRERADVFVGGEGYLCRDTRDRTGWVVPDCVVAFGVDPGAIMDRNGYVIDEVGKPPEFVLEIASKSTGRADYTVKRDVYAGHGVGEYWRFDSTGGEFYDAALSGERLVDGAYEPLPVHSEGDGVVRGYSPVLGLELHWYEGRLRFYDPAAGEYMPNFAEANEQRDAEAAARRVEAAARRAEAAARMSAETELQRLREEVRRLRSE